MIPITDESSIIAEEKELVCKSCGIELHTSPWASLGCPSCGNLDVDEVVDEGYDVAEKF